MHIEWLHHFLETAHSKSLSKSAEKLNISQAALSKQMKVLEDDLGVQLFTRTTHGMELTPHGEYLFKRIPNWLSELDEMKRQLQNLTQTQKIIIGCLPSLAAYYLPEKIVKAKGNQIQIDVQVYPTSSEVLDALSLGHIDAGISEQLAPLPKIFWKTDLFTEPFFAALPKTHLLSGQPTLRMKDIQDEPLVVYPPLCDVRQSIVRSYQEHGMIPNIIQEISFGESILGFVSAGAGISIIPEIMAKRIGHLGLVSLPIEDFNLSRTICLMSRSPSIGKQMKRVFTR